MAIHDSPDEKLTTEKTAALIGVEMQTLAVWRLTGRHGLPFFKVGKLVRYSRADVMQWLEERRGTSNSQIRVSLATG